MSAGEPRGESVPVEGTSNPAIEEEVEDEEAVAAAAVADLECAAAVLLADCAAAAAADELTAAAAEFAAALTSSFLTANSSGTEHSPYALSSRKILDTNPCNIFLLSGRNKNSPSTSKDSMIVASLRITAW